MTLSRMLGRKIYIATIFVLDTVVHHEFFSAKGLKYLRKPWKNIYS